MRLYNSQSKRIETIADRRIGIYVCGITPYDTTHLGHAFTFITFDVLVRYLRFLGKKVKYVQNVTDIDDDILRKAKELSMNWRKLARVETEKFLSDMKKLNWVFPDNYVRATDQIKEIIELDEILVKKGFAYEVGGSVYFEVKKDPKFGKRLNNFPSYSEMLKVANERGNIADDINKRDSLDFVLWQAAKADEPMWNSPWGKGRPGWHVECSVMSMKYLGIPVTIHGGGSDLKFPHHEAEISQSEKVYGKKFVKVWMHVAAVYIDGEKMSKSLGNMVFARDLLEKYSANAIRWYLLSHHWRKDWIYEEKGLKKASFLVMEFEKMLSGFDELFLKDAQSGKLPVFDALNNDLDTPKALSALFSLAKKDPKYARTLANWVFGLQLDGGKKE